LAKVGWNRGKSAYSAFWGQMLLILDAALGRGYGDMGDNQIADDRKAYHHENYFVHGCNLLSSALIITPDKLQEIADFV